MYYLHAGRKYIKVVRHVVAKYGYNVSEDEIPGIATTVKNVVARRLHLMSKLNVIAHNEVSVHCYLTKERERDFHETMNSFFEEYDKSKKMASLPIFLETVKPDLCTPCGGKCCKHMPGEYMPSDFLNEKDMISRIREGFKTGTMALDWWEGSDREYYIRPSIKGKEGDIYDPSYGGECSKLTENGCSLDFALRPSGCKALVPYAYGCKTMPNYGKRAASLAWRPHYELLTRLADEC